MPHPCQYAWCDCGRTEGVSLPRIHNKRGDPSGRLLLFMPLKGYTAVTRIGRPLVIMTVCSYWATRLPSGVLSVQPSGMVTMRLAFVETIGSIVKTMPSVITSRARLV